MIQKLTSALSVVAAVALGCAVIPASAITITTTNGTGADVQLTGWGGANADPTNVLDSASSTNDQINIRYTTNRSEIMALRFDMTGYTPANNTNYSIQLVNQRANTAATLLYYAVNEGTVGEDNNGSTPGYNDNNWVETNVVFSTMPGLHWTNSATIDQTVNANTVFLGSASMSSVAEGTLASFTSQALNDFMQTNADSVVTFIVLRTDANSTQARFATKEATVLATGGTGNAGDYAPRLKFTAAGCDPAVVTANPASTTVNVGNTANFTVTATGSSPTYQWQIKTNGTTTWFDISGATTSTYTTPATTTPDSGNQYRCVVAVSCDVDTATSAAATLTVQALANWTGGGGADNSWTTGANWDTAVAPGFGTNAVVGTTFTINFTNPAAAAFKSLTNGSTINVNTNGFTNNYTWGNVATALLNINSGGQMGVGGDLALFTGAGISLAPGGTLNVNRLLIGSGSTGGTSSGSASSYGRVTNNGGILIASSTQLNPGNGSLSSSTATDLSPILLVKGGTNRLGAVSIQRLAGNGSNPGTANTLGRDGLIISNGIVEMTSLSIGNNAYGTALVAGGNVTNTGGMIVKNATAGRPARFLQTGGLYVDSGVLLLWPTNAAQVIGSITGGTNIIGGLQFGSGAVTGTARFTNGASVYIGGSGIGYNGIITIENSLLAGGLFGAQADWTGAAPLTLAGSFTFRAAALDGTAHNISYNAALGGSGPLVKTGAGVMTLNGTNGYTGATLINQGVLALGPTGFINNSSAITVGSNSVLDVSAVTGGYAVPATKTLGGWGSVNGNVTIATGGIIDPGTNASYGTLTFSNSITATNGGKIYFDLSANPAGITNDLIVINGDLNVSGVSNIVQISGGGPAGSLHPLFKYYGNFVGDLTNFTVSGANGVLTNDTTVTPKVIGFRVEVPLRAVTNVTWVGNSLANTWNTVGATNWTDGSALTYFRQGDNVTFNAAGAANPNVDVVGSVTPASLVVNAATDYSFNGAGSIDGSTSLTKTNTGRLTIATVNTFSGGVNLNGGVLSIGSVATTGNNSPLGQSGTVSFGGGALEYTGPNGSTDRTFALNTNGVISVTNATSALTISSVIGGTGSLVKSGAGTLVISGVNTYGGTVLSNGVLQIGGASGVAAALSGPVTFNGGTLKMNVGGQPSFANPLIITNSGTIISAGGNNNIVTGPWSGAATLTLDMTSGGIFTVDGQMTTNFTGTVLLTDSSTGTFRFNAGGNAAGTQVTGSPLVAFDLGNSAATLLNRNGGSVSNGNYQLGSLSGGSSTTVRGASNGGGAANTSYYHIGARNQATTFAGVIADGSGGAPTCIVKVGTDTLTLSGASTYTGTTTVSNGVLEVNGSLGTTEVTVDGGTLKGTGTLGGNVTVNGGTLAGGLTINGALTVNSLGVVSPGSSSGIITASSSIVLNSGSVTSMEVDAGNSTNDLLTTSGTITYGGALNVTNLSGTLAAGQTYKLFNAANEFSYLGQFDGGTNLPALGGGLAWDTSGLATNGTISVTTAPITVNPTPTNIVKSVSGGVLTLSWPADHIGWTLQTQTNSRSVGLVAATNAWYDVSGSDTTNQVDIPLSPAQPTVFFRLRYPQP